MKKITRAQIIKLVKAGETQAVIIAHQKNKGYYFLNIEREYNRLTPAQKNGLSEYFITRFEAGQRNFYGLSKSDTDFLIKEYGLQYLLTPEPEKVKELSNFQIFIAEQLNKVIKNFTFTEYKRFNKSNKEYWYNLACKRACVNPKSEDVKTAFNYLVYN